MWSAVEVLCEVNGLPFDDVKREVTAMRNDAVEMSAAGMNLCKKNLLVWYKRKNETGDLGSALSEYAQLVFSVPFETVLIESLFSIMNYTKSGRRCNTGDAAVANSIHLRSPPPVLGDGDKPFRPGETKPDEIHMRAIPDACSRGTVDLTFDTSAALEADLTKLSLFTTIETAVKTMPTPPASGEPFKCYAEDWETTKDKRQRRGQGWRTRFKYVSGSRATVRCSLPDGAHTADCALYFFFCVFSPPSIHPGTWAWCSMTRRMGCAVSPAPSGTRTGRR